MQSANRKINSRKCKHEWKMEIITLHKILDRETEKHGIKYHRVRHRNLGNAYAIELHLLLPEETSVRPAHRQANGHRERD